MRVRWCDGWMVFGAQRVVESVGVNWAVGAGWEQERL